MTGFLGQAIRHTSHSGRDCLDNSKRGPPVSYERTWLRVRVTPALSSPPSPAHIAVMAKSHKPPRDPAKHSKSDPARPTRAKAARPEAPRAEPALDRLLNPGIERGTAGMGSGTGLQPPPDNSFDRRADFSAAHRARKSTPKDVNRASASAADRLRAAGTRAVAGARHQRRTAQGAGLRRRSVEAADRRSQSEAHRRRPSTKFPTSPSRGARSADAPPHAAAGHARRHRHDAIAGAAAARGPRRVRHRAGLDAAPAAAAGEIRRRQAVRASSPTSSRRATSRPRSRSWSRASSAPTAPRCCSASPARARPSPWRR